jgi:hypothetical protein
LDGWYKSILEDEMMEGDEIACSDDEEEDDGEWIHDEYEWNPKYNPPVN